MKNIPPLYLGSASSRRQQLLDQIGIDYDVMIPDIDESPLENEPALAYVERIAHEKAQYCIQHMQDHNLPIRPIICADTAIIFEQQIIGKPIDKADAIKTLTRLSGKHHQVLTVIALAHQQTITIKAVINDVEFAILDPQDIIDYCDTGEPLDKAGSYAIQGQGARFVKHISGSYSAIVGLPLYELEQLLKQSL